MWDARGAGNFERGSHRGYVANRAVDSPAVELDRSGLENTLPLVGSSLLHASGLDRKSEKAANRNIKISWFEEPPVNQGYCHAGFGGARALWDETSTAN